MSEGRFRIGIDEAGYGPTLGPLVIGFVRCDGPGRGLQAALELAGEGAPEVKDSKVLYRGQLRRLETTALAALACARGARPRTLLDLLGHAPNGIQDHPWYHYLDLPLPVAANPQEVDRAALALFRAFKAAGVWLEAAEARPLLEGVFNGRLDGTGINKAQVELELIEDLLCAHLPARPRGMVYCDRLGGRKNYAEWLLAQYPFWSIEVEQESPRCSSYILRKGANLLGFRFLVEGESEVAEIALASCIAKYARELMMHLFNRFWTARRRVRPTAGYSADARRFLAEMQGDALLEERRGQLVRRR